MGKLTQKGLDALLKKPAKRWPDGEGLFFKTARDRKAYFTFRFTLGRKETETSIGPHPEMTLDEARIRHLELRALVLKGIDPAAKRQAKAAPAPSGAPTFGSVSDAYLDRQEARGELGRTRNTGSNGATPWLLCPRRSARFASMRSGRNRCSTRSTRSGR